MSLQNKRLKAIVSHCYPVPHKYAEELMATAKAIGSPGKGILAADESTGTIGKRFKSIGVANTRANRRAYRGLLANTRGLGKNISGVILYEETLYEKMDDGSDLIDGFTREGIILGIKVDKGTRELLGTDNELYTQGLTDLDQRCAAYYKRGARFAKWRAVVKISKSTPSLNAITETAHGLARYAALCQANGLVPIVEPEILMDGDHDIATCQYWTEKVVSACYTALKMQNVLLEGTLLKPNMVLPGKQCKSGKATPTECAVATVTALQRAVPVPVPAITFLSGGQSEEEATVNLNALNGPGLGFRPWSLTFSFGRALQQSCLKAWMGKPENVPAAQKELLMRAAANGAANLGKYRGEAASGAAASTGTYVKNYTY